MGSAMKEIDAEGAAQRVGELIGLAQDTPVRVTEAGRPVGIVMSIALYERLRGFAIASGDSDLIDDGLTDAELTALFAAAV